jgi:hypothetical protein
VRYSLSAERGRLEDDMAIEGLHETLEPPNSEGVMRYVQFDALRIRIEQEFFDREIVRLASGVHPGTPVSRSELEMLLQRTPIDATKGSYDVVVTNAQWQKLIEYLEKGSYFYCTQGNPNDAEFVLAFAFGERYPVNSQIRWEIEATFGRKTAVPTIYAQWEVADMPAFGPGAGLVFNRIAIDPGKDYITSYEVAKKFIALSGARSGARVFLVCQAWHGPRCWRICEQLKLAVVGGMFVNPGFRS